MTTWIAELADLAAAATERNARHPWVSMAAIEEFQAACTPERIAALVRVAEEGKALIEQHYYVGSLADALRDLEATL